MSSATRELIQRHWALANARQWDAFAALLHPGLRYEVPQTREYTDSADGYLEMFRTWPGAWQATITNLVCETHEAICVIDFAVGDQRMTGISIFGVADGRIGSVTDYWPDPYEPPPRATPLLKRRPAPL